MLIGGIQRNSLIDFPGKVSCVLFTTGCNFDCPYCHNPELVQGKTNCPDCLNNNIYGFLNDRKGFLDGVVISGGEPTLQKDIAELCETVKSIGYPVKLDTNGSKPAVIKELIQKRLVDYWAMDIKTDPFNYSPVIKKDCNSFDILTSIRLIMESGIPYEFKTTCIKPLVNNTIIRRIAQLIQGAQLYALQQFQNKHVLHPEFFQSADCQFSDNELLGFKSEAETFVKKCIIR